MEIIALVGRAGLIKMTIDNSLYNWTEKPMEKIRIAVVGAGAIGSVTAAFISNNGWDVELVCKHQNIVDKALNNGLHVFGLKGDHQMKLKAVRDLSMNFPGK